MGAIDYLISDKTPWEGGEASTALGIPAVPHSQIQGFLLSPFPASIYTLQSDGGLV